MVHTDEGDEVRQRDPRHQRDQMLYRQESVGAVPFGKCCRTQRLYTVCRALPLAPAIYGVCVPAMEATVHARNTHGAGRAARAVERSAGRCAPSQVEALEGESTWGWSERLGPAADACAAGAAAAPPGQWDGGSVQ